MDFSPQDGDSSSVVSLHVARAAVLLTNDAGNELEPLWEAALLRLDIEAVSSGSGIVDLTSEVHMRSAASLFCHASSCTFEVLIWSYASSSAIRVCKEAHW